MKKTISLCVMIVVMLSMFTFGVYATTSDNAGLRYLYTSSCYSALTINGSTATCDSEVKGYYGITTKIEIKQSFEKLLSNGWWQRLKSWDGTFYSYHASMYNTTTVTSSGTYHVRTSAKVYSGSNYESICHYSNNVVH